MLNTPKQHKKNKGGMNGHIPPQSGGHSTSFMPYLQ